MDILSIYLGGDTISKPLFNSRFNETHPELSPDEHWLAYVSDESGKEEVYACSFPDLINKIQISKDGGIEPLWSKKGNELYYRDVTGHKIMAVRFIAEKDLQIGKPRLLFQGKFRASSGPWGRNYDITPDGSMFLMIEEGVMASEATQINVVLNWTQELKRIGKASDSKDSKIIKY